MSREFKPKEVNDTVTLRDIIALLMPRPPCTASDPRNECELFMAEMKARYAMADRIIREVR